jgi:mRNA interferase MazF
MARSRNRWPRRGEVYLLDFGEPRGHEMASVHPCVVLQNDTGNQFGGTTIVAAITGNLRAAALPIGVRIKAGTAGLAMESVANCSHLYTIDKVRLGKRIGSFDALVMAQIDKALAISMALQFTS